MVKLQGFKIEADIFPVGWDGGDEAAGSVENKDHLSPQLKLQLGLGWAWQLVENTIIIINYYTHQSSTGVQVKRNVPNEPSMDLEYTVAYKMLAGGIEILRTEISENSIGYCFSLFLLR